MGSTVDPHGTWRRLRLAATANGRSGVTRIRPWREWSLRSRMVVVIAALAAVGLLAASISGTLLLRSYLVQRVDQQLGIEMRRGPGGRGGPRDYTYPRGGPRRPPAPPPPLHP